MDLDVFRNGSHPVEEGRVFDHWGGVYSLSPDFFKLALLFFAVLAMVTSTNRCKDRAGEPSPVSGAQRVRFMG